MKLFIAALLSVALIWLHPTHSVNINNSVARTPKVTLDKSVTGSKLVAAPTLQPPTVSTRPVQTVAAQVTTFASGCSTYDSLFRQYAWDVSVAEAICEAESSGNPYALSTTCDRGLMQINCVHSDMVQGDLTALYDPTTNIAVAWKIYSADGWSPWSTYESGAYAHYL